MTLTELAEQYHCDKAHAHNYMPLYEKLFADRKTANGTVKKFLEMGIGHEGLMTPFIKGDYIHGCSLKMWRDWFPEAQIFGADNREDTLFTEDRISTFLCDQSGPVSLLFMVGKIGGGLDCIVDDGSHVTEHQILTFRTLAGYMNSGGVYCIEDVQEPERVANEIGGNIYNGGKRHDDVIVWRYL